MGVFVWVVVGIAFIILVDSIADYISALADKIEVEVDERRSKIKWTNEDIDIIKAFMTYQETQSKTNENNNNIDKEAINAETLNRDC